MARITAIGIYDNLPASQSCVPMRPTDNETSRRINKEFRIVINQFLWKNHIKYIFFNIFVDLILCHICIMLCGQNNSFQAFWSAVFVIFHWDLALAVRPQVFQSTVFSHLCQLQCQFMSQRNRIRHIFRRLVCSIAKHHPLIAGTDRLDLCIGHFVFFSLQSLIYTHGNIGRLLVNRYQYSTCIPIKSVFRPVITDFFHRIPYDFLNIHIGIGSNLSCHQHKTGAGSCFTCHSAHRIFFHQCI